MKIFIKNFSQLSTLKHEKELFEFILRGERERETREKTGAGSTEKRRSREFGKLFIFPFLSQLQREFIMCDAHDLLLVSC